MNKILLFSLICLAEGYLNDGLASMSITRRHKGDVYNARGEKCFEDACVGSGPGQPGSAVECECKCSPSRPVFRDDLDTCVDDMQECALLPFASGASLKKIPYVFLPLKGQIVYPSAEIIITGLKTPICVVSGGQFLGRRGWSDLRNNSTIEPPFRLFRDEGKTYLQWLGETSLRTAMEGRIILVRLMCKDAGITEEPKITTPCLAFRVAGNPSVREMTFASDEHLKEEYDGGLSLREYVAIGVCSLILAFVYVASVFLYLQWRRKHTKRNKKSEEDTRLTLGEEGIIKSNPLLQAGRHLVGSGEDNPGYLSDSNTCSSDGEQSSDLLCLDDEDFALHENVQTSAIIHPCNSDCGETILYQDTNNLEKLPEENVSIVETLEAKDEHSEAAKAMGCSNSRRKLYFNPTYFEPDLLKAPPPAALEFLVKIREVIAIAKHKMSAKKFSPSLLGIPEEDGSQKADNKSIFSGPSTFLKLESREENKFPKRNCTQEPSTKALFVSNEFFCQMDAKQKIIRKWLEDVPVMGQPDEAINIQEISKQNQSKTKNRPTLKGGEVADKKRPSTKGKAPPPPTNNFNEKKKGITGLSESSVPPQPPPLPCSKEALPAASRQQIKDCVSPTPTKNLMDAVIQELAAYKKSDNSLKSQEFRKDLCEIVKEKGDTMEASERQELKIEKVDFQIKSGINKDSKSKDKNKESQDDHDYEVILLTSDQNLPCQDKRTAKDLKIYNLPEILSKNDQTEGYSLVSEVYVNDSYSCCSGESSPSSFLSIESDKIQIPILEGTPGRLTIHVNDSTDQYKNQGEETDNFEPDTLDRKPRRSKSRKKISRIKSEKEWNVVEGTGGCGEGPSIENFTDSLERPNITLKTAGTFNGNSEETSVDDLFRNFTWSKIENFGSLREIYEAKSKNYKRTETTSLTDFAHVDADRISTLSWQEERKNKLLHHGIVLHVDEEKSRRRNSKSNKSMSNVLIEGAPARPPKPSQNSRSETQSPLARSTPSSVSSAPKIFSSPIPFPQLSTSSRTVSPPLPPPRTVPASTSFFSFENQVTNPFSGAAEICDRKNLSDASQITIETNSNNLSDIPRPPECPASDTQKKFFGNPPLPPRNARPPLPPKSLKSAARKPPANKLASRPLPPLPSSRPANHFCSSPLLSKDVESLSSVSGASTDSLNFSDYEAFYTLPYEEGSERVVGKEMPLTFGGRKTSAPVSFSPFPENTVPSPNQKRKDSEKSIWELSDGSVQKLEDFGYLSTDSGDSSCPAQTITPSSFSRILQKAEPCGSQNSETEESVCDGASESGAESTTTDSFFYGDFHKAKEEKCAGSKIPSEVYSFSLRLSDVEVNSDSERHCVPIMVRP